MIQAKLYNIKINVKNLEESVEFYEKIFSELGFKKGRYWDDPYDEQKTYTMCNNHMYMELVENQTHQSISLQTANGIKGSRIEFLADSQEEVDKFHKHLLKNNVQIVDVPKRYYEELWDKEGVSNKIWYAVYFLDNNGIKYGLVYTNDSPGKSSYHTTEMAKIAIDISDI